MLVGTTPLQLPAILTRVVAKPTEGYEVAYVTAAVLRARRLPTAADSFAEILARSRLGMAMAAMMRMIATTINNSMRENPLCLDMPHPPRLLYQEIKIARTKLWGS